MGRLRGFRAEGSAVPNITPWGCLGLKVLFVSTSYPRDEKDWRGRFTANLVASLARYERLNLSLWVPPGQRPTTTTDATTAAESRFLANLLEAGGIAQALRKGGIEGARLVLELLLREFQGYRRHRDAALTHVNWLQNVLPLLGTKIPMVVSVLGSDFGLLRVPGMRWALRRVMQTRRCVLVPNADWMAPSLQAYFGDLAEVRPIPYGVDPQWFDVQRCIESAQPQQWLVVSRLTRNKIGPLFDWGENLFQSGRELHLFGPVQEQVDIPDWVSYHGPTHPAELSEQWFPKAAGLITLSTHDEGRPQVMLEAMAAGLPIIASNLAAHRDIVTQYQTGFLVESREEFLQALTHLGGDAYNLTLGENARTWTKAHIGTWEDCAERYIQVYESVLVRAD